MIAIFIDKKLNKFSNEIKYTFDFIFRTAGFEYKYISNLEAANFRDIIFFYGLIKPTETEISVLAKDRSMFFIPAEPDLLQPGLLNRETIEKRIIEAKYLKDIPLITDKEFEVPIVYYKNEDLFFGSFSFDLIGNIFFHLVNYEFNSIGTRDKNHLLPDSASCFTDFSHKPFINAFLWLLNEAIKDSVKERANCYLIKKCYWPEDQPLAAAISHNVESLKKWTFSSLIKTAFQDLILFYRLKNLVLNSLRRLKYIITNIEEYWTFELIYEIEKEFGVQSTFFWGTAAAELKEGFDYSFQDEDIVAEIKQQKAEGDEIALLGSLSSYKEDILGEQKQKLTKLLESEKTGVRQFKLRYDPAVTPEYHSKYVFQYDSTRALTDRNGFKNGIGFPFYNISSYPSKEEREFALFKTHNCLELPLVFSDNNLLLSEVKNINYEQARDKMAALVNVLKFYNGLITFNFSVHNFAEIPYNKNLYRETLTQLQEDKAFLSTYSGIADWWTKRDSVLIKENKNELSVYFPDQFEKFTLLLLGTFKVDQVEGAEVEFSGAKIIFSNLAADTTVKIKLVKEAG
jgi:hypothetical protein